MAVVNERNRARQEDQTQLVGIVGTVWFSLIAVLIIVSIALGRVRSAMAKRFAIYSLIACLLELPRFVEGITDESIGRYEYSAHLIGSIPQFLSFTTIIVSLRRELFPALFGLNAIVFIMALITTFLCLLSKNMHSFFASEYFFFYALYDATKNVLMGIMMVSTGKKKLIAIRSYVSEQLNPRAERNISNLLLAMSIATACFLSRMCMQVLKAVALSNDSKHVGEMRLYSLPFRVFDDFVPIGLPILPFLFILTRRQLRQTSSQSESSTSAGKVSLYDYHFDDGNDSLAESVSSSRHGGPDRGNATSMDSSRFSRWSAWSIAESTVAGGMLGLTINDLGKDRPSVNSLSGFSAHDTEFRDSDFEMASRNTEDKGVVAGTNITAV